MLRRKLFAITLIVYFNTLIMADFIDSSMITVTPSGNWPGSEATNLVNGSGLMPDLTVNADPTDAQNWLCHISDGRWLPQWREGTYLQNYSPSGVHGDGWVQFEFDTAQAISKMWVWNYNNPNYLGRGWESVAVDYSTDGTTWARLGGGDTYLTFNQATGQNGYECNNIIDFDDIVVKKIVMTVEFAGGNYGDPSYSGLSEVRFEKAVTAASIINPENDSFTDANPILSWTAGTIATYHDLYFGTNLATIEDATPLYGDINGTGKVDLNDLTILTEQWLKTSFATSDYSADITNSSKVNLDDFSIIAKNWFATGDGLYKGHFPLNKTSYNPGKLAPNTTYYWKVDEANYDTVYRGNVWKFTTMQGTNIATESLGAITVPSSQSYIPDDMVENIIDDNPDTFWISNHNTFPNWVEVRWAQPILASGVSIEEKNGYNCESFRIDVFNTLSNQWQTIVGPKNNANPGQTITELFEMVEILKLRFYALTGYNGATQSGIASINVFGTNDWIEACEASLPPFQADMFTLPAASSTANYMCTYFNAVSPTVTPGEKLTITFKMRKLTEDSNNYGFQIRVGELISNTHYYSYPNYADFTVAIGSVMPSTPTSQWNLNQDYTLSASIYIPEWAPHGNIPVSITPLATDSRGTVTNVANNIVGTCKIQRFETDPSPLPAQTPTTTIVIENDQANLYVNGSKIEPYIMTTPDFTTYQSMGEQMFEGCKLWRILSTKSVDASYNTPQGDAENAACFAELDQKIRNLLKIAPDAYILPVFGIRPSEAWSARWPNESTILSNGTRVVGSYSLSSTKWANQIDYDYRALVAHMMAQDYSGHIIGVSYEIAKETQYWGCWENSTDTSRDDMALGDFSDASINAFRNWLASKYGSESSLQAAWKDNTVTFSNAFPTPSVLRRMDSTLMFKDPALTKLPMDYWQFHSEAMAKMAIVAAKAVKEASSHKYITGLWGFYSHGVYATATTPGTLIHMGHTALQTVLASPYIDYLAILHSYSHRHWGDPSIAYQQGESIRRHGKLSIIEMDNRTFFTPLYFTERTFSEPETISVMYNNAWGAAIRGDGLWWVGFSAGATYKDRHSIPWFASESINETLVNGKIWYDAIRETPSQSNAEVAVFINNADIHAMDAYDGYKPQVSAQYQTVLFELTKLGAPVDYYELNDISQLDMSQYKVFVFLSAYNLTTPQRDAIKAIVRQTGKTAVWLYGAGYNNGATNSVVNIEDLTGIGTEVTLERRLPTINFLTGDTLTANIPIGYTLSPHKWEHDPRPYEIGPIFNVNDSDATQLGTYSHNGKVAYATKMVSNGRSIFMAIPYMSAIVLRDICRVSDVFLYSQNDLYLNADEHFILITNGESPFNGNISLPFSSQVYDLWNDTIVGSGTSFTANIPPKVSRMYFYGTEEEVATFKAKIE